MDENVKVGRVYLVGAGPGDLGLFTLRGAELLSRADVVVFDALVSPEIVNLSAPGAERIYGGKRAKDHAIPQEDLNRLLVRKAKEGKVVVRLKGGDPYLFGRGGEEAEELEANGVSFEVVPGISSFYAAPNYAGIPITHRDFCSNFTVWTGHEDPTKEHSSLDWERLVKLPGTKVILMGVERLGEIVKTFLQHGESEKTPIALVRWGTTGRQESLVGTLQTITSLAESREFKAPAVMVIGGVVELRKRLNWFETRPLFRKRVVVTRTRSQVSRLSKNLSELGAEVWEIPTIRTEPPQNKQPLLDAFSAFREYDWLIFTSPNGVDYFFDYFFKAFKDIRDLGNVRIAAVGPATRKKLQDLHLVVDVVPEKYVASEVANALAAYESIENLKVMLARAEVASEDLPRKLEELGGIVDDIPVYRTVPETEVSDEILERLEEEGADWITFTSSSTVEHFNDKMSLPSLLKQYPSLKVASIGPETTKALVHLGCPPTVEAMEHTIEGLVRALQRNESDISA